MVETQIPQGSTLSETKKEKYKALLPSLQALVKDEPDLNANLGNLLAALKEAMGFHWIGLYRAVAATGGRMGRELVLGPFQGPVACTRIGYGKGVCGACWQLEKVLIVPDVHVFPGHIACSALSKSEIVLPVFKEGRVAMVLDVDSQHQAAFDETDSEFLLQVVTIIERML